MTGCEKCIQPSPLREAYFYSLNVYNQAINILIIKLAVSVRIHWPVQSYYMLGAVEPFVIVSPTTIDRFCYRNMKNTYN